MSGRWAGRFYEWACPTCGDARCSLQTPETDADWLCRRCELAKERDAARAELATAIATVIALQAKVHLLERDLAHADERATMWRDEFRRLNKGDAA